MRVQRFRVQGSVVPRFRTAVVSYPNNNPHMKLHESNVIRVNFHTWLHSSGFVVVVLDDILILEDENENEDDDDTYQIRSPETAYSQHPNSLTSQTVSERIPRIFFLF